MSNAEQVLNKITSKRPSFPHTVSLEMWPEKPIYKVAKSADDLRAVMGEVLRNIEGLSDLEPNVAIKTAVGSNRTEVVVTPPKKILDEANQIN